MTQQAGGSMQSWAYGTLIPVKDFYKSEAVFKINLLVGFLTKINGRICGSS